MTALQLEPDVVVLDHLDEAWDIACEVRDDEDLPPCGAHADWWLLCRRCGASTAECNPHRVDEHRLWTRRPDHLICGRCSAYAWSPQWRDLFTVTPIEGRP